MMNKVEHNPSKQDLKKFGLIMGLMIPLFFGLLLPIVFSKPYKLTPWIIGSIFLLSATIKPKCLKYLYIIWMYIGLVLGWVNSKIILGIIFYGIFTPISILFYLTGRDILKIKLGQNVPSYRIISENIKRSKDHMEKPY